MVLNSTSIMPDTSNLSPKPTRSPMRGSFLSRRTAKPGGYVSPVSPGGSFRSPAPSKRPSVVSSSINKFRSSFAKRGTSLRESFSFRGNKDTNNLLGGIAVGKSKKQGKKGGKKNKQVRFATGRDLVHKISPYMTDETIKAACFWSPQELNNSLNETKEACVNNNLPTQENEQELSYIEASADWYASIANQATNSLDASESTAGFPGDDEEDRKSLEKQVVQGLEKGFRGLELYSHVGKYRRSRMQKIIREIVREQPQEECTDENMAELAERSRKLSVESDYWARAMAQADRQAAYDDGEAQPAAVPPSVIKPSSSSRSALKRGNSLDASGSNEELTITTATDETSIATDTDICSIDEGDEENGDFLSTPMSIKQTAVLEPDSDEAALLMDQSQQQRLRAYRWYSRLAMPTQQGMHEKFQDDTCPVAAQMRGELQESDIDLLPWNYDGTRVHVAQINAILFPKQQSATAQQA